MWVLRGLYGCCCYRVYGPPFFQEDLSHEMCPHKPEFPFIRVPVMRGWLYQLVRLVRAAAGYTPVKMLEQVGNMRRLRSVRKMAAHRVRRSLPSSCSADRPTLSKLMLTRVQILPEFFLWLFIWNRAKDRWEERHQWRRKMRKGRLIGRRREMKLEKRRWVYESQLHAYLCGFSSVPSACLESGNLTRILHIHIYTTNYTKSLI